MRIAILFLAIIVLGCNEPQKKEELKMPLISSAMTAIKEADKTYERDSILMYQQADFISIQNTVIKNQRDSISLLLKTDCSKLQKRYDSLYSVLKIQNARLYQVGYYVNICNRNPSQDKFLRGWVNRSLK